jgi:hypothetical protein
MSLKKNGDQMYHEQSSAETIKLSQYAESLIVSRPELNPKKKIINYLFVRFKSKINVFEFESIIFVVDSKFKKKVKL